MSESGERETQTEPERNSAGVLANLPRTRPQRSSARRIAAREGATAGKAPPRAGGTVASTRATTARANSKRPKETTRKRPAPARARPHGETAPRQGFESESESARGPISPPGGAELITAATELLAEVTRAGLSRGAGTLKGLAGRLRLG